MDVTIKDMKIIIDSWFWMSHELPRETFETLCAYILLTEPQINIDDAIIPPQKISAFHQRWVQISIEAAKCHGSVISHTDEFDIYIEI